MKRYLLFAISILILLASCQKESLYYEYSEKSRVRLNIDWTQAGVNPNGASVYIYNTDGTLYSHELPFADPSTGIVSLPPGDYKMIVFNDTPEEYADYINFVGMDNWETASALTIVDEERTAEAKEQAAKEATAKEANTKESAAKNDTVDVSFRSAKANFGVGVSNKDIGIYVKEPDTLAAVRLDNIHINGQKSGYYTTEPELAEDGTSQTVSMVAERIAKKYDFRIHVKGLKYAQNPTQTDLVGLSKGYYLGKGVNMDDNVTNTFILNNRKYDEGSKLNGTITGSTLSLGLRPGEDCKYYLIIHFVLVDKSPYPITVDITDFIKKSGSMSIDIDLELPYAEDMTGAVNVGSWSDEPQNLSL